MKKNITILGEPITIAYNIAVELSFEEITGKPVLKTEVVNNVPTVVSSISTKMDQVSMWLAVIMANNPDSPLVAGDASEKLFQRLTTETTLEEVTALEAAITACMKDWYHIPSVVTESQDRDAALMPPSDEEEEERPKN